MNVPNRHRCTAALLALEDATWRRRGRRLLRVTSSALVLAGASLLAAACGGPSTPGVATGPTTTASSGGGVHETGLLAYSSCMRSHGVPNFPDPASSGGISKEAVISAESAESSSQVQSAQNNCRRLLPSGGLSGRAVQTITAQQQRYYLDAASCMHLHGIPDFPEPSFYSDLVEFQGVSHIANLDPQKFAHAWSTCVKDIPAGLPYSAG